MNLTIMLNENDVSIQQNGIVQTSDSVPLQS